MGKYNDLPDDLDTLCCCGHRSGMHMAATYRKGKLVDLPAAQTGCAFCSCSRFVEPPATWQITPAIDPLLEFLSQ